MHGKIHSIQWLLGLIRSRILLLLMIAASSPFNVIYEPHSNKILQKTCIAKHFYHTVALGLAAQLGANSTPAFTAFNLLR